MTSVTLPTPVRGVDQRGHVVGWAKIILGLPMAYLSLMIANELKNGPRCFHSVFDFDTSTLSQMIVNDISDAADTS